MIRRVIEGKFSLIHEAENGSEAVDLYQKGLDSNEPYHIVLMDSQMPVMNGLDATRAIREMLDRKMKPLILGITGNAMRQDIDKFIEAGADRVIPKPLNLDEFFYFICSRIDDLKGGFDQHRDEEKTIFVH